MHRSKIALPAALCFFLCSLAAKAWPAGPPDTPQGRRMAALLAAFDTGTPEAIRQFVTANFAEQARKQVPLEERVGRLGGMAKEIGPLEFHSVVRADGPEVLFLAREKKSGDWIEVGMMLEPGPAFGIMGLKFEPSEGPGAAAPKPAGSDAAAADQAGKLLRPLADAGDFSGVVLLAKDGKTFFQEAYGLANRDFGAANRTDTKFNLGSINKVFTQVAIAQLAAAGRLSLSDTIRKLLPDYPSAVADRITVQQLITMSSGLGDFFGPRYDATPKTKLRTLSDFLPLFVDEPLLFEPSTSHRYSNAGYIVLGLIIEKVSGEPYHDYVRKHVFEPAGMRDSDAYPQDAIVANRAVGYTREDDDGRALDGPPRVNIYALPARSSSAGGGYSTAGDLLAFDVAMRHDRLLAPAWTDWFFGDKTGASPTAGGPRGKRSGGWGFAGGTSGVNAVIETDLDTGYTIVVLSNLDPPSAERVTKKLRGLLPSPSVRPGSAR